MNHYKKEILDEELNNYVGVSNPVMWAELRDKYKLAASVEELLDKQLFYKKHLIGNMKLQPIKGIKQLLDEIKSCGIRIGLASSSSKEFINYILDKIDLKKYFEVIVSGEDVVRGKPAPDIFRRTAELLNVQPEYCLVIEDSAHGVKAAKLAQMKCIGFSNPNSGKQDLSLADAVINEIVEIDLCNY